MIVTRCVYHDSSTKGFRHGIGHKRHDCWRGDLSYYSKRDGGRIHRVRKRFKCPEQARQWVNNLPVLTEEQIKQEKSNVN